MSFRTRLHGALVGGSLALTLSSVALAQGMAETTAPPGTGPQVNGQSLTQRTTDNSPVDRFGEKGQLAISSDAALTIQNSSIADSDGSVTTITLSPAVDYFVIKNLSIGGNVLFAYESAGDTSGTRFGVGPRVGYNLPLSDLVSIWPKAGLSISHTSQSTDAPEPVPGQPVVADTDVSNTALQLNLFVPVMFHPAEHFFAGFGPFLDTDLNGDNRVTTFGGKLTIGGYIPL